MYCGRDARADARAFLSVHDYRLCLSAADAQRERSIHCVENPIVHVRLHRYAEMISIFARAVDHTMKLLFRTRSPRIPLINAVYQRDIVRFTSCPSCDFIIMNTRHLSHDNNTPDLSRVRELAF